MEITSVRFLQKFNLDVQWTHCYNLNSDNTDMKGYSSERSKFSLRTQTHWEATSL